MEKQHDCKCYYLGVKKNIDKRFVFLDKKKRLFASNHSY